MDKKQILDSFEAEYMQKAPYKEYVNYASILDITAVLISAKNPQYQGSLVHTGDLCLHVGLSKELSPSLEAQLPKTYYGLVTVYEVGVVSEEEQSLTLAKKIL